MLLVLMDPASTPANYSRQLVQISDY